MNRIEWNHGSSLRPEVSDRSPIRKSASTRHAVPDSQVAEEVLSRIVRRLAGRLKFLDYTNSPRCPGTSSTMT